MRRRPAPPPAELPRAESERLARYLREHGPAVYADRFGWPPPPEVERAARALRDAERRARLLSEDVLPEALRSQAARGRS